MSGLIRPRQNDNLDHENRPVKYSITPDELRQIQQRRIEAHAAREISDGTARGGSAG